MAHLRTVAAGLAFMGICTHSHAQTGPSRDKDRDAQICVATVEALKVIAPKEPWRLALEESKGGELWRTAPKIKWPVDQPSMGWVGPEPQNGRSIASEKPSDALIETFLASPPINGVRCKSVRDMALKHDALNPEPMPPGPFSAKYARSIVGVEKAVLSADGAEALVYGYAVQGPLAASGLFHYFRKQSDGSWREIGVLLAWVS